MVDSGVLYISERRRAPQCRVALGSLCQLLHPLDAPFSNKNVQREQTKMNVNTGKSVVYENLKST